MMFRKDNCAASEITHLLNIQDQTVAEGGVQHKRIPGNTQHVCNDQFGL